ncbi:MAG TPA: glycosyltransferase 87 family protein [Micromonosporaceae bacterium]
MSVDSAASVEEPGPVDAPSRSDGFVRGLSEAIGGPLGDHAVDRDASDGGGSRRFWTAARIILALTCLTLALHWVEKSPCQDGAWRDLMQYKKFCYTDVLALYYAEGLNDGKIPYLDHPVEYPVVTGLFMGAIGLPVYAIGAGREGFNQGMWFYDVNALVLGGLAVASAATILALRRRRPWDAALFALSPALLLTATVNWDLLAIALAVFGIYAWARKRPVLAGVLLGLGTATKLWPGFLFVPLILLGLRAGRSRPVWRSVGVAVLTWAAVNLPVMLANWDSWHRFIELNTTRGIDWGTLWYVGDHFPRGGGRYGFEAFHWLGAHIDPQLNYLTYALILLAWLGIGVLTLMAPRRPRFGQLAFLVVATFLIFNKVWSQQFVLWLLPLIVLARPRWGAFLAWQAAEVCYFFAFYGELMGASGRQVFPEGVFVLAAGLRLVTVAVLCGLVVRDILRPEQDAVRQTYDDDPDGGVLDGAPDADWLTRRLAPYGMRNTTASPTSSRSTPSPSVGRSSAPAHGVPAT